MSEAAQPKRERLKSTHIVVVVVWAVLAGWLMGAMTMSVVDAIYYGDGPLNVQQAQAADDEVPGASTHPKP